MGLIRQIHQLKSGCINQLNFNGLSNNKISYVRVPQTSTDCSFYNTKEWLDIAIQISGSRHNGTFEAAYRIANHILCYYRDSFFAACETQRVSICKPMTATEFQGIVSAAGLNGTSAKILKKHLTACLGKGFCPTRQSVDMLSDGHSEVKYNMLELQKYSGC